MLNILLCFASLLIAGSEEIKNDFALPLEIPLRLSANFGELRPGHFHSGIDIKTEGKIGKNVLSIDEGYVYRISVSPFGFGNALYIMHPNGLLSLYGHLDRFNAEIEKYVTAKQYDKKSFGVELYPDIYKFTIKKGEQIGFSGNSGSSAGPHLHFELRHSINEHPIDPLDYFDIPDNTKPTIKNLAIYPLSNNTEVNGKNKKIIIPLTGSNGKYSLSSMKLNTVSGTFGVGISAYDIINGSRNKCGVKSIKLTIDKQVIYKHTLDEFSFAQTRYINSHIDYEELMQSNTNIQEAFVEPNNSLSIYDTLHDNGKISFNDNNLHYAEIEVRDYADNISQLNFVVKNVAKSNKLIVEKNYVAKMPFNITNTFSRGDLELEFPPDSFYDTILFMYSKVLFKSDLLSDVHYIHTPNVPVHKSFSISIKPNTTNPRLLNKAGIVRIFKDRKREFVGGSYKNGYISAEAREFGKYSIACDSSAPVIKPLNFTKGSDLSSKKEIKFKISDNLSGISSYSAYIDRSWALMEWDPKKRMLKYVFRKGHLNKNTTHNIIVVVTDKCANTTEYKSSFRW